MNFKTVTDQKNNRTTFYVDGKRTSENKYIYHEVLCSIKGKTANSFFTQIKKGKIYSTHCMD